MKLLPGDVFATRNPMALGRAINAIQKFWSYDNEAIYSHTGVIVDYNGVTLECLWTVRHQNIYEAYQEEQVIIARYEKLKNFNSSFITILEHFGQWYPVYRLLFHLIPPVAKYVHFRKHLVCSEFVAKFLHLVGGRHEHWHGTNPDMLVDEWRHWKNYKIIFEGTLSQEV